MDRKSFSGFTLIELIMTMLVASVLAGTGAYLLVGLVYDSVATPNKLIVGVVADDVLDAVTEGTAQAGGLRWATNLTAISATSVAYREADGHSVVFSWDSSARRIYCSVDGNASTPVPSYVPKDVFVDRVGSNPIFSYFDANGSATADPNAVRRVEMQFAAQSGSGKREDWQYASAYLSGIAVRKFQ
jgi:prepilin-type N-terminal cleavage/methylation domain-containing protein